MGTDYQATRVLITVMTYPHPSREYKELVCTAGITDDYEWVRLYPIPYRYQPRERRFRKYQWIEVNLAPRGRSSDARKESREPLIESIKLIGEQLDTKRDRDWRARRAIIDKMPVHIVKQLETLYETEKVSLGIVRPKRVLDVVEEAEPDWKPEWQVLNRQFNLFGDIQKPLQKIPFKFSYKFECEDHDKPYTRVILDWELGVLCLDVIAAADLTESIKSWVKDMGKTVIVASHRMGFVERVTNRVLWLKEPYACFNCPQYRALRVYSCPEHCGWRGALHGVQAGPRLYVFVTQGILNGIGHRYPSSHHPLRLRSFHGIFEYGFETGWIYPGILGLVLLRSCNPMGHHARFTPGIFRHITHDLGHQSIG